MDREFLLWQNFAETGAVKDYLAYKSASKQNDISLTVNPNNQITLNKKDKQSQHGEITNEI